MCLGTRNGREVDLFRCVFYQNVIINSFVRLLEARRYGWNSRFPFVESVGRSALVNIKEESVIGVEINPDAERPDVAIGSFDDMPSQWTDTFRILYSNSFDQSQDPYKTAKEWVRVCQGGGMVIIGFADAEPNVHDPVGSLTYRDFLELFPGQLLYFNKYGSNYSDIIIKIDKG